MKTTTNRYKKILSSSVAALAIASLLTASPAFAAKKSFVDTLQSILSGQSANTITPAPAPSATSSATPPTDTSSPAPTTNTNTNNTGNTTASTTPTPPADTSTHTTTSASTTPTTSPPPASTTNTASTTPAPATPAPVTKVDSPRDDTPAPTAPATTINPNPPHIVQIPVPTVPYVPPAATTTEDNTQTSPDPTPVVTPDPTPIAAAVTSIENAVSAAKNKFFKPINVATSTASTTGPIATTGIASLFNGSTLGGNVYASGRFNEGETYKLLALALALAASGLFLTNTKGFGRRFRGLADAITITPRPEARSRA